MYATSIFSELASTKTLRLFQKKNIKLIVEQCVTSTLEKAKAERRNIAIETEFGDAGDEFWGVCEQVMLASAIEETLSNAIKYTPDGKNIRLTMRRSDPFAEIKIADEGIGISPENLETVYKPYFSLENRFHHSTGRYKFQGGGIGIGLSIARLVMEYHNGSISIHSGGKDKGTTVTLAIPLQS